MSFLNLLRVKEIRTRILVTLGLLFCYRIGFVIPLPGVNTSLIDDASSDGGGFQSVLGLMNVLTGAQLQGASLFALGVMPYISASIIFSLLTKVVPSLEKISKEGPSGQRKINRYTRYATIPICLVQALFVILGPLSATGQGSLIHPEVNENFLPYALLVMVSLTAGTLFIMWLGEQITQHGIGNGISLIIMGGIVAGLPKAFTGAFTVNDEFTAETYQRLLLFLGAWIAAVVAVVYMTKAQRRIPIQQSKQTRGRRVYGGQRHFLPLKVNHAGVMPIIFASALLIIPSFIGSAVDSQFLQSFAYARGFWYILIYGVMIFFFSFFWTSLMFQPTDIADNLKDHGSFIPGIRPGKNTAEFLEKTMLRITLAGAAFLTLVAVFPSLISGSFSSLDPTLIYFMSGTSILIVVGVALDLVEKLNGLLVMRNYEGFMKESNVPARGWGRQAR
ncbi:MAG: preprotein translocase subunit SecY [Planctomycetota bacterium]